VATTSDQTPVFINLKVDRTEHLLAVNRLGPNTQAAIRTLLTEFRFRGWHDPGNAALAIVRALEAAHGVLPPSRAARAVPADFLSRNNLSRHQLAGLLTELASRSIK
jgi:hypothetical protein